MPLKKLAAKSQRLTNVLLNTPESGTQPDKLIKEISEPSLKEALGKESSKGR